MSLKAQLATCGSLKTLADLINPSEGKLHCQIGCLGGRYFRSSQRNVSGVVSLNDIVKCFERLQKEAQPSEAPTIESMITLLDNQGKAQLKKQCCLFRALTLIKQSLGNRGYNRAVVLQNIVRISDERMKAQQQVDSKARLDKLASPSEPRPSASPKPDASPKPLSHSALNSQPVPSGGVATAVLLSGSASNTPITPNPMTVFPRPPTAIAAHASVVLTGNPQQVQESVEKKEKDEKIVGKNATGATPASSLGSRVVTQVRSYLTRSKKTGDDQKKTAADSAHHKSHKKVVLDRNGKYLSASKVLHAEFERFSKLSLAELMGEYPTQIKPASLDDTSDSSTAVRHFIFDLISAKLKGFFTRKEVSTEEDVVKILSEIDQVSHKINPVKLTQLAVKIVNECGLPLYLSCQILSMWKIPNALAIIKEAMINAIQMDDNPRIARVYLSELLTTSFTGMPNKEALELFVDSLSDALHNIGTNTLIQMAHQIKNKEPALDGFTLSMHYANIPLMNEFMEMMLPRLRSIPAIMGVDIGTDKDSGISGEAAKQLALPYAQALYGPGIRMQFSNFSGIQKKEFAAALIMVAVREIECTKHKALPFWIKYANMHMHKLVGQMDTSSDLHV